MSLNVCHPYHLVDESPWPLLRAFGGFFLTTGLVIWFHSGNFWVFLLAIVSLVITAFQWWRDVRGESRYQGLHSGVVEIGLRWGIILFIVSEVFFFLSFFWTYFHIRLAPRTEIGGVWGPIGLEAIDPLRIPLLNTTVLIVSGISVTWAHHALIEGNHGELKLGLAITFMLGILFTGLQLMEYAETSFSMADRCYGSVFFIATGFHGVHVLVGTLFLISIYVRARKGQFRAIHHFGFEARAWYWHFVDVVWLFLYLFIYWWGRV